MLLLPNRHLIREQFPANGVASLSLYYPLAYIPFRSLDLLNFYLYFPVVLFSFNVAHFVFVTGTGCQVAGFLTVFATHLSVFTLTVITIERWYAIVHAINLNKRIKIRAASIIMACGWIYSIIMSSLPLFGISNYSSTR